MSNEKHTGKTSALHTTVGLTQAQLENVEHCAGEPEQADTWYYITSK